MELKEIQALIKFVSQNGVDEVEINRKDFKLHIKKNTTQVTAQVSAPAAVQTIAAPVAATPAAPAPAAPAAWSARPRSSRAAAPGRRGR